MAITIQDAPNANGVMQNLNTFHRKNHDKIWTKIYSSLKSEKFMSSFMSVKDEFTITTATITKIIKRFACEFEPSGDINFKPQLMNVRRMKADFELCCMEDLQNSYMADMYDLGEDNKSPKRFIRWIFEALIIPQIIEELEYASVAGWYDPNATAATSDYTNVVDGIGTIAERLANNALANVVPTGAITSANAHSKIEDFLEVIPKKIRRSAPDAVLWTSEQVRKNFWRDRRASLGGNTDFDEIKGEGLVDDYTKIPVEDFDALSGSNLIFWSPKWNIRKLYNTIDIVKGANFDTQKNNRCINVMADWRRGYGFIYPEYVWVNDQPLHGVTNV